MIRARRRFLPAILAPLLGPKKQTLEQLIIEYDLRFSDAEFIGNTVIYTRETWDEIRESFRKIIDATK